MDRIERDMAAMRTDNGEARSEVEHERVLVKIGADLSYTPPPFGSWVEVHYPGEQPKRGIVVGTDQDGNVAVSHPVPHGKGCRFVYALPSHVRILPPHLPPEYVGNSLQNQPANAAAVVQRCAAAERRRRKVGA